MIIRDDYLNWRLGKMENEDFIYLVYLDTNPKEVLNISSFINSISHFFDVNYLIQNIIYFYDNHFTLMKLYGKRGELLKIY